MPTYTVYAPPPRQGETASAPERFVFVRDGFHLWAFLFTPLWLIAYRLWSALAIYIVIVAGVLVAGAIFHVSIWAQIFAIFILTLLAGFEASTLRRWTFARHGWSTLGFVIGDDQENAERRFFYEWLNRPTPSSPNSPVAEPKYAMPVHRGSPSGNDVIGLFPEPELRR